MKRKTLFGQSDSEGEEQSFIVCQVGTLKQAFKITINIEIDEVDAIKWLILKKLELLDNQAGIQVNAQHPLMHKIRLFSLRGGIEI